jgi:aminopeptidase
VSPERLDRYADLIVRVGANVQDGQTVFVNSPLEHAELVRALTRASYPCTRTS